MSLIIERLPAKLLPGWDCRNDNANCKSCNWLRANGKPRDDHGIHGDGFLYTLRTELPDGRAAAITLEVFTSRYPATVNRSSLRQLLDRYPYGASLDLHIQVPKGGKARYDFMTVHETCDALGPGRRCDSDGSGLIAQEIYERSGIQSDASDVDLLKQPDALYAEMEHYLRRWTEDR
jgi:hypothetical protein